MRYNGLKNELDNKDFDNIIQKELAKVNGGGNSVGCIDPGTGRHELSGEAVCEKAGGVTTAEPPPEGCRSPLNVVKAPSEIAADSPAPGELVPRRRPSGDNNVAIRHVSSFSNVGSSSFSAVGTRAQQAKQQRRISARPQPPPQGANDRKRKK